ncbi:hypothetical protein ACFL35_04910 [Candidatus Riflebacteria bacterium]
MKLLTVFIILLFHFCLPHHAFAEQESIRFTVETEDLSRFMHFIKPLSLYDFHYQKLNITQTRVTVYPKLPDKVGKPVIPSKIKRNTKQHVPLQMRKSTVKKTRPGYFVILKLRDKHIHKLENALLKSPITVTQKMGKKHGRLEWVLRLPGPEKKKIMRKFLRRLNFQYHKKGNIFEIR